MNSMKWYNWWVSRARSLRARLLRAQPENAKQFQPSGMGLTGTAASGRDRYPQPVRQVDGEGRHVRGGRGLAASSATSLCDS